MEKLSLEEVKIIELNILIKFANYCKKNNLHYYLAYGTLLGAVRHNGFIPWDDDIDVIMPRKDFEKLTVLVEKNKIDDNLEFFSISNNKLDEPIGKVVDNNTLAYEDSNYPLWIDVFPYDYYDKNIDRLNKFYRKVIIAKKTKNFNFKNRKDIVKFILKYVFYFKSVKKISLKVNKRSKGVKPNEYIGNTCFASSYDFMKLSDLRSTLIEFEGLKFKTFKNYDDVLNKLYGDYMKIPPKKYQKTHNINAYYKYSNKDNYINLLYKNRG